MEEVFSEFYFGYEVSCNLLESRFPDRLLKEDRWKAWAEARKPKLHVQRIYKYNDRYLSDSKPHYQLFMVLPHWNRYLEYEIEKSSRKPEEIANAPKEEAHVVFDRDWALLRETVQEGQKPEIDKRYRLKGEDRQQNVYAYTGSCRVKFDNGREDMENSDRDFSGAGYVELSWDENGTEYCIKFDYFVNFVFRKPVYYSLKVAHGAVVAKWSGCVYGKDLPVKLLHSAAGRPYFREAKSEAESKAGSSGEEQLLPVGKAGKSGRLRGKIKFSPKEVADGKVDKNANHYALALGDASDEKFYVLKRIRNAKEKKEARIKQKKMKTQASPPFCPYCHKEFAVTYEQAKRFDHSLKKGEYAREAKEYKEAYREGAVSCQGNYRLEMEQFNQSRGHFEPAARQIFCEYDFQEKGGPTGAGAFESGYNRLLPAHDYVRHPPYKLVMFGAPRAGKSTYLASLFDVRMEDKKEKTGAEGKIYKPRSFFLNKIFSPNSSDDPQQKGGRKGRYTISSVEPEEVEISDSKKLIVSNKKWLENSGREIYKEYCIPQPVHSFLNQTLGDDNTNRELKRRPFLFDIGEELIACYDISGEVAEEYRDSDLAAPAESAGQDEISDEQKKELGKLLLGGRRGVCFVIDGRLYSRYVDSENQKIKDARAAETKTLEQLCGALTAAKGGGNEREVDVENIPIAVVVTKFDYLEEEFEPNAACLRGDCTFDRSYYEGSDLEENIEQASCEINSYLNAQGFSFKKLREIVNPEHIRFFGVSVLQFEDSISHRDANMGEKGESETNTLLFRSSPKRVGLPLIWMMHQFGIVK